MAKVTVNIEEMEIGLRQSLFGFTIGKGVHVSIWASDQGEAIKRFREMTEEDVVFITDAEMERRKAAA